MKSLYLISQTEECGYESYDSAVVCAESAEDARKIRPDADEWGWFNFHCWATKPENVAVKFLGHADEDIETGIILASFNAG